MKNIILGLLVCAVSSIFAANPFPASMPIVSLRGGTDYVAPVATESTACSTACSLATVAYNSCQAAISALSGNQCDGNASSAYSKLISASANLQSAVNTLCNGAGTCQQFQIVPALRYAVQQINEAHYLVYASSCLSSSEKNSIMTSIVSAHDNAHNAKTAAYDCCN